MVNYCMWKCLYLTQTNKNVLILSFVDSFVSMTCRTRTQKSSAHVNLSPAAAEALCCFSVEAVWSSSGPPRHHFVYTSRSWEPPSARGQHSNTLAHASMHRHTLRSAAVSSHDACKKTLGARSSALIIKSNQTPGPQTGPTERTASNRAVAFEQVGRRRLTAASNTNEQSGRSQKQPNLSRRAVSDTSTCL